jgi:hypothetical protein
MKAMIKIFIFILLVANLSKCEKVAMDKRYAVYLKNNAEHSIGAYFALGGEFGTLYPDTTLPETKQYVITEIKPDARYIYDSGIEWEEIYSKLPKDTMSVYVFHTDTLQNVSWEDIRNNYKVLKRYDLSLDDLKRMNWTITYP